MDTLRSILLPMHITAGFISLILFWVPVFTRKGGKVHNLTGKAYVWGMWITVASAAALCLINLAKGRYISASFLGFLTLITSQPLWYGITVLRHKRGLPTKDAWIRKMLHLALFTFGSALIVWSLLLKVQGPAILLMIFGVLGVAGSREAFMPISRLKSEVSWLADHLANMIITGIAAHTAFMAFGGRQFFSELFTGSWVAIPWTLPTVIGVIAIKLAKKRMGLNKKKPVRVGA